ncbi:MAG: cold shock domain-containing protein [Pseudomonadota bacterium]
MSIPGKVLIALLSALFVAVVAPFIDQHYQLLSVFIPAAIAALLAVVLSHRALPVPGAIADGAESAAAPTAPDKPSKPATRRTKSDTRARQGGKPRDENSANSPNDKRRGQKTGKGRVADGKGNQRESGESRRPAPASDSALENGTVKWFNVSKGYGFIIRENGDEIFVHHRSVQGEGRGRLDDGSSVRFRVVTTDKGPQAEDVEPV